jgi:hypothetical protein
MKRPVSLFSKRLFSRVLALQAARIDDRDVHAEQFFGSDWFFGLEGNFVAGPGNISLVSLFT